MKARRGGEAITVEPFAVSPTTEERHDTKDFGGRRSDVSPKPIKDSIPRAAIRAAEAMMGNSQQCLPFEECSAAEKLVHPALRL